MAFRGKAKDCIWALRFWITELQFPFSTFFLYSVGMGRSGLWAIPPLYFETIIHGISYAHNWISICCWMPLLQVILMIFKWDFGLWIFRMMLKQISFLGLLRRNENITQWYNFGLEEKCYSPYVWSPYLIQIRRWSFGARHSILINISRTHSYVSMVNSIICGSRNMYSISIQVFWHFGFRISSLQKYGK